jgi:hypothetical protein
MAETLLNKLETQALRWSDKTHIGYYTLLKDSEFLVRILSNVEKESILEHLQEEYPEYFEEEQGA